MAAVWKPWSLMSLAALLRFWQPPAVNSAQRLGNSETPVSYTHLTLPTTPYV